jgi:hypothetical protein
MVEEDDDGVGSNDDDNDAYTSRSRDIKREITNATSDVSLQH